MKTISISPPNSLILIMDFKSGRVPEALGNNLVAATDSCIAIGCRSEYDGPTDVYLAQPHECTPSGALVFEGDILTPSRSMSVCTVMNKEVLSDETAGENTHVRVFANDPIEPDRIFVIFGGQMGNGDRQRG
jgi:hypothetical protein